MRRRQRRPCGVGPCSGCGGGVVRDLAGVLAAGAELAMVFEVCAAGAAKAVISRIAASSASALVARAQDEKALQNALAAALRRTDEKHGVVLGRYGVNTAFFEYEGAGELARVLLPGPGPDARRLARAYLRSLGGDEADADALVEPFESLLSDLRELLGRHERFRVALSQVTQARTDAFGELDERELLEWTGRVFAHVRTAGLGGAEHVQLKLDEVFVAPRGLLERHAGRRWRTREDEQRALLDDRLRNNEITHDVYEVLLDRLALEQRASGREAAQAVDVVELVKDNDCVVILGEPGSGKTTLMKYLALRHAAARLDEDARARGEIGAARLPLYVRAGDFSRSRGHRGGLRAFIAPFLGELECPVDRERVDAVLEAAFRAGRCVLLVDGLDEVTSAQDRARVVEAISDFVAAQHPRGNKVVCTSRLSGYAAAPLPPQFVTVRLTEMDDAMIERFLELYVPAIEFAEAGGRHADVARAHARRTVDTLLSAFRSTPGVRRLAANPLLLTALLLVHRTRGALPERRVDAYKAVTDALAHSWRAAQGVPIMALPNDQHLTKWLTRLAAWMHQERPEGSATRRDLLELWGPLWAEQNHQTWDPKVLDAAEPSTTEPGRAVVAFAEKIEEHCGLLVERAPRRWGFPHLTFEEFYTGRALAFEGRARIRPKTIRARLHDPRYDEPILLALGLLGRDQPEELDAVFRAAILATGDDAADLNLHASADEDLLGRDYRFALRALADDIPIAPGLVDELLGRAIDELLDPASNTQFTAYRDALVERLAALKHLRAGIRAGELLAHRLADGLATGTRDQQIRLIALAGCCTLGSPPSVVSTRLTEIVVGGDMDAAIRAAEVLGGQAELPAAVRARLTEIIGGANTSAARQAAQVLGGQGELPAAVSARLTEAIGGGNTSAARRAAQVLGGQGELPAAVRARLTEITGSGNTFAATQAAQLLAAQGELPADVSARLTEIIGSGNASGVTRAAQLLGGQGELPADVSARLTEIAGGSGSAFAATRAAQVLAGQGELPAAVSARLTEIADGGGNSSTAIRAAQLLAAQGELPAAISARLTAIADNGNNSTATRAAQVLAGQGELPPSVSARLTEIIGGGGNASGARRAAQVLAGQGELPPNVSSRLTEIIGGGGNAAAARRAAQVLAGQGELPPNVSGRLTEIAGSGDAAAAAWAADVLAGRGELPPNVSARLSEISEDESIDWRIRMRTLESAARSGSVTHELVAVLLRRLGDPDSYVRKAASDGLVHLARDPTWTVRVLTVLRTALADPALSSTDRYEDRRGYDYAYDALWQVTQTTPGRPSR